MLFKSRYCVDVYYIDDEGFKHYLDSAVVNARTKGNAILQAYDAVWDERLNSTGCSPDYKVYRVSRG